MTAAPRTPLQDDLDALYGCPLGEFVDRRKALAQAARKAGRKDDAAVIAAAPKPSPAAWAVNQLARQSPEQMADLFAIGAEIRAHLRATFAGRGDAMGTLEAQSDQRAKVRKLTDLAGRGLESGGLSSAPATLDRVSTTLTALSTTGTWGDRPAGQLSRELDLPSLEVLATLIGDEAQTAIAPAPSADRARETATAGETAAERQARIESAEAALQAAAAVEEQRRAEVAAAQSALETATATLAKHQISAREARAQAIALAEAAEQARRAAESGRELARAAEEQVAAAAAAEQAARAALGGSEQALSRARSASIAAEETLVRARRDAAGRPSGQGL